MKWLSLFFILGLITIVATFSGTMAAAEPMPRPRGRPATTKRPHSSDGNNADNR